MEPPAGWFWSQKMATSKTDFNVLQLSYPPFYWLSCTILLNFDLCPFYPSTLEMCVCHAVNGKLKKGSVTSSERDVSD